MIQVQTLLKTVDNSGAYHAKCIKCLGGFNKKNARCGDIVIVSIQSIRLVRKVKPGQIYPAVIVRTAKEQLFKDGSKSSFGSNSIVLLNAKKKIMSTRVIGPISRHLRKKKTLKLIIMAGFFVI